MIDRILRRVDKKHLFISMILSIIFATFIVTMFFGNLQVVEDATMDSLTYYDAETFYQNLELQGETGRASYLYLHVFDYFFMVSFALFLITVIALLVKRIDKIQRVETCNLKVYRAYSFESSK